MRIYIGSKMLRFMQWTLSKFEDVMSEKEREELASDIAKLTAKIEVLEAKRKL